MNYQIERPSDKDLFESSGHSNAAAAIENVILNQSDIHAIGLEGELGSGKSTVLKLLEKKLPDDKYKFITFDVEQFHHSSTKASFIKHLREQVIKLFGSDGTPEAKRVRRVVLKAADRALGNDLTYTKNVKSNLSWYTVSFAISLMLSVRYAKEALEHSFRTLGVLLSGSSTYSFGLDETIVTALGVSPLAVALVMAIHKAKEKDKPEKEQTVPNVGDIFKRNSQDKITEKLHVTREVGTNELKRAFEKIVSAIPTEQCVVLVIDNLDRVEKEKVREVWSDLEVFTSFGGNNLRVIVPFSEKHVASALSDSGSEDGTEFILKRLPVKFRTPPIVSAGWRQPFEYYWNETLEGHDGIQFCAELIDIWIAPHKQITPRFLKTHINEIRATLASNPENVSTVACSAYLLAQRSESLNFKDVISNEKEQEDPSLQKLISWTHKVLRKTLTEDEWSSQIMSIHYQTNSHIARSELLENPLKRAISLPNFEEVLSLSSLFGFDIAFRRILGNLDPYDAINLSASATFDKKEHVEWLKKWLPEINIYLVQEKDHYLGYNPNVIKSFRILDNENYQTSKHRLITEHRVIRNALEKAISDVKPTEEILKQLYDLETIIGLEHTPNFISKPSSDYLVHTLWHYRDDFPGWKIIEAPKKINLDELINEIIDIDFNITNNLIENISSFLKIGQISFSDDSFSSSRTYTSSLYSEEDYPQVLLCSDFDKYSTSISLTETLETIEDLDIINNWTALTLVSCINSNSLSSSYANTTVLEYILENYYKEELQLPLIEDYLSFSQNYDDLLSVADKSNLPEEIKKIIFNFIGRGRVHALSISNITNKHYSRMREYLDDKEINETLSKLLGWKSYVFKSDPNAVKHWSPEFISDALNFNNSWENLIVDWFDSKEHDKKFWHNFIKNNTSQLNIIVNWYIKKNKKIRKSSAITSCIIDNQDGLISNERTSGVINSIMDILPSNSLGKIEREISLKLLDEQLSHSKKQTLIEHFGSHIYLPDFDSKASKGIIIHLIENARSQEVVDWLCSKSETLSSITWGDFSLPLSQAIKNISEHFDIGALTKFILEEANKNEDRADSNKDITQV